MTPTYAPF